MVALAHGSTAIKKKTAAANCYIFRKWNQNLLMFFTC